MCPVQNFSPQLIVQSLAILLRYFSHLDLPACLGGRIEESSIFCSLIIITIKIIITFYIYSSPDSVGNTRHHTLRTSASLYHLDVRKEETQVRRSYRFPTAEGWQRSKQGRNSG